MGKRFRVNSLVKNKKFDNEVYIQYRVIYEIYCSVNGRKYIGSTVDFTRRLNEHITGCLSSLVFGSLTNVRLIRDVNEFGIEKFYFRIRVKCFTMTYEELHALEMDMIKREQPYYNIEGK